VIGGQKCPPFVTKVAIDEECLMRVFLTGSRGFMGSHLAEYLTKQGNEVFGIDNLFHSCEKPIDPAIWTKGDIRNVIDLEKYIEWADVVVHLAAQIHVDYSIQHPQETLDINVKGTLNVLELCRKYRKRVLIASTSEAYGSSQSEFMDENHPLDCQSPYGASKVAADRLAKAYIDTYGMDIVIIRNFNAFGPFQNDGSYGSVIAKFTRKAMRGECLDIYGDGSQERDYMYIDDIVSAYDFAIHKLPRGVYNFGTGKTVKIKEVAQKVIQHVINEDAEIVYGPARAGEVQRLCCDTTKVKSFGWTSKTNFDYDLERYVKWYKETYGISSRR